MRTVSLLLLLLAVLVFLFALALCRPWLDATLDHGHGGRLVHPLAQQLVLLLAQGLDLGSGHVCRRVSYKTCITGQRIIWHIYCQHILRIAY